MTTQCAVQEPDGAPKQPPVHIPDHLLDPKFVISMNRALNAAEEMKMRERFPRAQILTFEDIRTSAAWVGVVFSVSKNHRDVFVVLANPEDFPLAVTAIAEYEIPHGRVFERVIKGKDGKDEKVAGMVRIDVQLFEPERIQQTTALKVLFFVDRKRRTQLDIGRAKTLLAPFMPKELMESGREKEWKEPVYLDGPNGVLAQAIREERKPTLVWFERCTNFIKQQQRVIVVADLALVRMGSVSMKLMNPDDEKVPLIHHLTVVQGRLYRIHAAFREL